MRYNPPPTWPPPPPGWQPPPGWHPPPEWGPPPPGWAFWVDDRPPRPSVWSTLGIALGSALVLGLPLGLLLAPPGGDVAYWMGRGFGQLVLPALLIGGLWPFVLRRASRWFIPLAVLLVGGLLSALLAVASLPGPGSGNVEDVTYARPTDTPVSPASS